jgi:hypothetical protein
MTERLKNKCKRVSRISRAGFTNFKTAVLVFDCQQKENFVMVGFGEF